MICEDCLYMSGNMYMTPKINTYEYNILHTSSLISNCRYARSNS